MNKALEILTYMKASFNDEEVYEKFEEMSEDELKTYLDEAIVELEEAMKPKTCDGCVYDDGIFCLVACVRRFTHDAYNPKNNA